uniref:Uncharacterized protein n=1 Tax=Macrostomum lignano TaxID=282301 RepID=A0A1I8JP94_9PLAT
MTPLSALGRRKRGSRGQQDGLLYLHQREMAVVSSVIPASELWGSDGATSCLCPRAQAHLKWRHLHAENMTAAELAPSSSLHRTHASPVAATGREPSEPPRTPAGRHLVGAFRTRRWKRLRLTGGTSCWRCSPRPFETRAVWQDLAVFSSAHCLRGSRQPAASIDDTAYRHHPDVYRFFIDLRHSHFWFFIDLRHSHFRFFIDFRHGRFRFFIDLRHRRSVTAISGSSLTSVTAILPFFMIRAPAFRRSQPFPGVALLRAPSSPDTGRVRGRAALGPARARFLRQPVGPGPACTTRACRSASSSSRSPTGSRRRGAVTDFLISMPDDMVKFFSPWPGPGAPIRLH